MVHRFHPFRTIVLLVSLAILSYSNVLSQNVHFRNYGRTEGLPGRYVYSIDQDADGYLWVGTDQGLYRFDGQEFRSDFLPDSLHESFFSKSCQDASGRLWFCIDNTGLLFQFDGREGQILDIRDLYKGSFSGITTDEEGQIIVATPNRGLLKINAADISERIHFKEGFGMIQSLAHAGETKLLVGTSDGLFLYSLPPGNQPPLLIRKIEGIPSSNIQVIHKSRINTHIFIGTDNQGLFILEQNESGDFEAKPFSSQPELNHLNVRSVVEDYDGHVWIGTNANGLIKVENGVRNPEESQIIVFDQKNGLNTNNVRSLFQDFEGNIWVGTYGAGISMLLTEAFKFYRFSEDQFGKNVYGISSDSTHYYLGGERGIMVLDKTTGEQVALYNTRMGLPDDHFISLMVAGNTLYAGTQKSGLYLVNIKTGRARPFFISSNNLEKTINDLEVDGDRLWVATRNGILLFSMQSGQLVRHFTTEDQLRHNNIYSIFLDNQKRLWPATLTNVPFFIDPDLNVQKTEFTPLSGNVDWKAIISEGNGDLWIATERDGVLHFMNDSMYTINGESGLKSSYCYSLIEDQNGLIWVGHREGFSRINDDMGLIKVFGREQGIMGDANNNSGWLDENGKLLLGTSEGMVIYDWRNDKPMLEPPRLNIKSLQFNDELVPLSQRIVMPYASYKLIIDFVGISFRNPDQVLYEYMLENYDSEWSGLTDNNEVIYPRLEDGTYTFYLRAYNADIQTSESPLSFTILVKKPIWKTWWFLSLLAVFMILTVIVIVKIRERRHRKLQAYLQKELDIRTREVVEQKEEIELKNREITDSINYAQRIQASILPPIQKLTDSFEGSFVYYQPRDIVSGDFYWWDRVDDHRFLIVCADSTGHGVPGAFMSMIGATLIKDMVNRNRYIRPSELLRLLDHEITTSLNQNVEVHASSDGMDIIVCEFNTETRQLRFASAMRPIIMYHRGEQYYIRGNRSSVGGEAIENKLFEDQEYQLQKGDVVYLFSDGYPDQFGGPMGKKLKMVRLKNLLDDIHDKNMDEQYNHVKQNFEIWKKGFEQVDDVLFMGLKV